MRRAGMEGEIMKEKTKKGISYKDAGVDIDTKGCFTSNIYSKMQTTFGGRVIENPGGFGVVLGAEPLFFLDYLASSKIVPKVLHEVIDGIVEGCRHAGCSLIGGETPEMPGFYQKGEYDIAGFVVGVVEKDKIINGKNITPGDVVLGLGSNGIHSNGYSLVRKIFFDEAGMKPSRSLRKYGLKTTLGEEILKPTRIYVKSILKILNKYKNKTVIKGMAHITGGGLLENIPRILPEGCSVRINKTRWDIPAIFKIM